MLLANGRRFGALIALLALAACGARCESSESRPSRRPERSTDVIRREGNHLATSSSVYLLQHAHNPVDWYPLGARKRLARARAEDKPIFLSIGYSSCHWCHVMEADVFEKDDVATFLNAHFISIKVDREERPDLDEVYMAAALQAMSGSGGGRCRSSSRLR